MRAPVRCSNFCKQLIFTTLLAAASLSSVPVRAADITVNTDTTWTAGTYTHDGVVITNGATLTTEGFVRIEATNLTVDTGCTISADATGHPAEEGPGAGTKEEYSPSGGGYGGRGGDTSHSTGGDSYGSAVAPVDLGSGGGSYGQSGSTTGTGGPGGGAIRLDVSGASTVNGTISSNGGDGVGYGSGGGSGGSVYITTGHLTGSGAITAHGGNGSDSGHAQAGGGGGRIAVHYQSSDFSGTAVAEPGVGTDSLGEKPGTVGFFDTDDGTFHSGPAWRFEVEDSPFELSSYTLIAGTIASIDEGVTFGDETDVVLQQEVQLSLYPPGNTLTIAAANLSIAEGATVSANAMGYPAEQGAGAGIKETHYPSGGGYGGRGGSTSYSTGGESYGSAVAPVDLGSGGGSYGRSGSTTGTGGTGGGAIRLDLSGTLTLDGTISSNGSQAVGASSGGGSGGSVNITTGHFTGPGAITANGGDMSEGAHGAGGGGGGRIAVHYQTSDFSGTAVAEPGTGVESAGEMPGTVGFFDTDDSVFVSGVTWRFEAADSPFELSSYTLIANARADIAEGVAFGDTTDVTLETGAELALYSPGQTLTMNGANLSIAADATVSADAAGYAAEEGPGAGTKERYYPSGGGHGGLGGSTTYSPGGITYGSAMFPTDWGSGGGSYGRSGSTTGTGGTGGGAIRLDLSGTLTLDGTISANGSQAVGASSGGGSGGSVNITTGHFAGSGAITANGGDMSESAHGAGGGGGGRIAVHYATSDFEGTATAEPGTGIDSNGEEPGTVGFFDTTTGQIDLVGMFRFEAEDADSLPSEFTVPSGAELQIAGDGAFSFDTFTIDEGAVVTSLGYPANLGPGAGLAGVYGAGGGYGGRGGNGGTGSNVPGGEPYGSAAFPTDIGSGGGGLGGAGGGAIRLTVADMLTVNGILDANGRNGAGRDGGGGSGGSLYLTAGALAGSGRIEAKGGAGTEYGGGGGGGRIAIYYISSTFTGTMSVDGGAGREDGDTGTALVVREMPLTLGEPVEMDAEPYGFYNFRLELGAGETTHLVARLTPLAGSGEWSFTGRYNDLAGITEYDWLPAPTTSPHFDILIPSPQAATYYFGVYCADWTGETPRFRMECFATERYLAGISVGSGGNTGSTTVEIGGLGFEDGMQVQLRDQGGGMLAQFAPSSWWHDSLTVSMDLSGHNPQTVDVVVIWPDSSELLLEDMFEIVQGGPEPELEARIVLNDIVRNGRINTLWIEYENVGDVDMPAPLLALVCAQDYVKMRLDDNDPWQCDPIQLLAVQATGDAGVLPPGASNRIPVRYLPTGGAHAHNDFTLIEDASGNVPVDWNFMKAEMRPLGVDEAVWDRLWPSFAAELGTTWGEYLGMLRANATYLGRLDQPAHDVSILVDFELRKILGSYPDTILSAATDTSCPGPGFSLSFARVYYAPIQARFHEGPLGRGWTHRYDLRIDEPDDGVLVVYRGGQSFRTFSENEDSTFSPMPGNLASLAKVGNSYVLTEKSGSTLSFGSDGAFEYMEDRNGNRITATYDGNGRLTGLTHSDGDSFALDYDGSGRLVQLTDHANRTITYEYTDGNLTAVTGLGNTVTTYNYYDDMGGPTGHALASVTFPGGLQTCFEYDGYGRLTHVEDCSTTSGASVSYTYHDDGRVGVADAAGTTVSLWPDQHGLFHRVEDNLGRTVETHYDEGMNLTEIVNPAGGRYRFAYDHLGNPIQGTDPTGALVQFAHDTVLDVPTSYTDPNWNETGFEYDDAGNTIAVAYADGSREELTRDAQGDAAAYVRRDGTAISMTRNARGQVTRIDYPDSTWATYAYDTVGRLVGATDAAGTIVMEYNDRDLLIAITYPTSYGYTYEYSDSGQLTRRVSLVDGWALNYAYDDAGRLAEVADGEGAAFIQYEYDSAGRITLETKDNSTYTTYSYDEVGRVSSIVHYAPDDAVQARFDYVYDANGNVVSEGTLDGEWTYTYDPVDRVTSYTTPDGWWETYEYDTAGNRSVVSNENGHFFYAVNELNQYVSVNQTAKSGAVGSIQRDLNGNITSKVEVDKEGRTRSVEINCDEADRVENVKIAEDEVLDEQLYVYNPLGQTKEQTTGPIASTDRLQVSGDPVKGGEEQINEDGKVQQRTGDGRGVQFIVGPDKKPLHLQQDSDGNTQQVNDNNGDTIYQADYDPAGAIVDEIGEKPTDYLSEGQTGRQSIGNMVGQDGDFVDVGLDRPVSQAPRTEMITDVPSLPAPCQECSRIDTTPQTLDRASQDIAAELWAFLGTLGPDDTKTPPIPEPHSTLAQETNSVPHSPAESPPQGGPAAGNAGVVTYERVIRDTRRGVEKIERVSWPAGTRPPLGVITRLRARPRCRRQPKVADTFCNENVRCEASNQTVNPGDPNEKVGPVGWGANHIVAGDEPFFYTVYFENDPEIATAPAQEVFVTDVLDENLDWSTFRLTEITWADHWVDIPADAAMLYSRETVPDYRPEVGKSWWVDVTVEREGATVQWIFRTLDPETGDLPGEEWPLAGFLPVNDDNHIGEGHVSFTIWPKPDLPLGTVITNQAAIVFDINDPIVTNEVFNTIGVIINGDVNGDGDVNALDVQLVINEALGIDTGYDCDLNGDGSVNALDVQLVINAALGIEV